MVPNIMTTEGLSSLELQVSEVGLCYHGRNSFVQSLNKRGMKLGFASLYHRSSIKYTGGSLQSRKKRTAWIAWLTFGWQGFRAPWRI